MTLPAPGAALSWLLANPLVLAVLAGVGALLFVLGWAWGSRGRGLYVRCPVDGDELRARDAEGLAAFILEHERRHPGSP